MSFPEMKRTIIQLALLFYASMAFAQVQPPCVDSLRVNPYFSCYIEYDPVCACDSNTYRNYCFAYSKAGANYWRMGICNNEIFDIDLVPIPVSLEPFIFSAAFRIPSSCHVFITDVFGSTVFSTNIYTTFNNEIKTFEIETGDFRNGVYSLFAVVNGEKKYKKFLKVRY